MKRDDLYDLAAFAVVAEQGSFTRAAAELGMSQSALSHAIKSLEERLGAVAHNAIGVGDGGGRSTAEIAQARTR
jgi:molybdenum-dependent DNA-binding transcriptional regulator ModE